MGQRQRGEVHRQLHSLFHSGIVAGISDEQLLERFTTCPDEEAGQAFAALVERYGPMVLRVCDGILSERHDAQDAFQATFLVLVKKARSIHRHASIGSWLYGVALRVANEARRVAARRLAHERNASAMKRDFVREGPDDDLKAVVHEEIGRLPEHLRSTVILCYMQGRTCEEAAAQLGWPVGTVKSRLARARARLGARLIRRGVAPSIGVAAASLECSALPVVSATLGESTARAALWLARSNATVHAEAVSASVITLIEGAVRTMAIAKTKLIAGNVLIVGVLTIGTGMFLHQTMGAQPRVEKVPVAVQEEAPSPKPLGPRSLPRWEYTSLRDENIDAFNKLGDEGWELCGVASNKPHPQSALFIFKRRAPAPVTPRQ